MIGRARMALLVALIAGIVITATEFPLGQLLRGRAEVAHAGQQLRQLQTGNRALASEVGALSKLSTVAGIAHEEYGLVSRGQQSVVVLPSASSGWSPHVGGAATGPLASIIVPKADLVPSDAIVSPGGGGGRKEAGFWDRFVQRLEFWKALP